ncbi:MAG: hypothetical protein ABSG36_00905 [Acidimicrobiales bacterium]|jgi:hypothetical protein
MTLSHHPARPDQRQNQYGDIDKSLERCVELTMPARPELWGLARMSVASIASKLDFDLEQIEDLRLAVDELSIACAKGATSKSVLKLSCYWDKAGIYLDCSVVPVLIETGEQDQYPPEAFDQKELSETILGALVDAHGISAVEEGARTGWIAKRH